MATTSVYDLRIRKIGNVNLATVGIEDLSAVVAYSVTLGSEVYSSVINGSGLLHINFMLGENTGKVEVANIQIRSSDC